MPHNCGGCKYFRPGERVKTIWPNGEMVLEDEDEFWRGSRGACTANPDIRPMRYAWFHTKAGYLNTIGTTRRSGRTCERWDDGGRDLITMELEKRAVDALERAAYEAKVSTSELLVQMVASHERKLKASKKQRSKADVGQ